MVSVQSVEEAVLPRPLEFRADPETRWLAGHLPVWVRQRLFCEHGASSLTPGQGSP